MSHAKPWKGFVLSGLASGAGYALLFAYLNDREVMAPFFQKENWWLPVLVAFGFSFAHGAFTGYFWDVMGIRARSPGRKS